MPAKVFLDTNVAVYAYDRDAPEKQKRAQEILEEGLREGNGVVSAQVLGEFFNVVTRRIKTPMSADEAQEIVSTLGLLSVVELDLALVQRAIDTHKQYQVAYWDALIIASAERAGCDRILSEDLSDGQRYHGIAVSNPFA